MVRPAAGRSRPLAASNRTGTGVLLRLTRMKDGLIKYGLAALAVLLVGPLSTQLLSLSMSSSGLRAVPAFNSTTPVVALVATLLIAAAALLIGAAAAKFVGLRWGLVCTGLALLWPAGTVTPLAELMQEVSPGSPVGVLLIDNALLGAIAVVIGFVLQRLARDRERFVAGRIPLLPAGVVGIAIAAACGVGALVFIALSARGGQAIFAAVCAGALAGQLLRAFVVPAPVWTVLLGLALVSVVGPVAVMISGKSGGELARLINADSAPALIRILGWQWLAGGTLGLGIGLSWNAAQLEQMPLAGETRPAQA